MSQGKIKSHRYAPHEINNADKIISIKVYDWNQPGSTWLGLSKDSFQYDNLNNEILEIIYNWSGSSNDWERSYMLETFLYKFPLSSSLILDFSI